MLLKIKSSLDATDSSISITCILLLLCYTIVNCSLSRLTPTLGNVHLPQLLLGPRFNFSVEFRRNFGVFFIFASYREEKFRYFSPFFVFKFKNSKIFIKNSKKI